MAYGESNGHGHMADDDMWLRKFKVMTPKRLAPISQKQLEMLFNSNR